MNTVRTQSRSPLARRVLAHWNTNNRAKAHFAILRDGGEVLLQRP